MSTSGYFQQGQCGYARETGEQCNVASQCASGVCALSNEWDPYTTCQEALVVDPPTPSQRAREKRRVNLDALRTRFLCPRGMTMCLLDGFAGYECIDTTTSLEHCGGCNNAKDSAERGADCSELGEIGALSVQCQQSRCVASEFTPASRLL